MILREYIFLNPTLGGSQVRKTEKRGIDSYRKHKCKNVWKKTNISRDLSHLIFGDELSFWKWASRMYAGSVQVFLKIQRLVKTHLKTLLHSANNVNKIFWN